MTLAYHFVGDTLRDGRPVPPDGQWLIHDGPAIMCESGLHASRHPFDALQYAPGNVLCLVDCDDIVDEEEDKLVCRRRRIVARFDASRLLREFAADCAEEVLHLVPKNYRLACIWAINAARRYARGEYDVDELIAAYEAAYAAGRAEGASADAEGASSYAAGRAAANAAAHAADAAANAAACAAAYAARRAADVAAYAAACVSPHIRHRDLFRYRERFAALVSAQFAKMGAIA